MDSNGVAVHAKAACRTAPASETGDGSIAVVDFGTSKPIGSILGELQLTMGRDVRDKTHGLDIEPRQLIVMLGHGDRADAIGT